MDTNVCRRNGWISAIGVPLRVTMKVSPDSKCVVECVKGDKNTKYALFDGKNVYVLSDQKTPEQFAGKKVTVTGTLYEKTKILKVDSIADGGNSPASAHRD